MILQLEMYAVEIRKGLCIKVPS